MKVDISLICTNSLRNLRNLFLKAGFDIRFVGGCVRDLLANKPIHDIDLCTSATPDQQIEIYNKNNIKWIATGLQHGTIQVMLDDTGYEITSLRVDTKTDGRHAIVEYTSNWYDDLSRRDFTINAMSLDFEGNLFDPFNGYGDLQNGCVRFVGDAETRVREDYLRILRWFRFRARYEHVTTAYSNLNTRKAITLAQNIPQFVSPERILSEIKKILLTPCGLRGLDMLIDIHVQGVAKYVHLPVHDLWSYGWPTILDFFENVTDPIARLVALYKHGAVEFLQKTKASNAEIAQANAIIHFSNSNDIVTDMVFNNVPREWIIAGARLQNMDPLGILVLQSLEIPRFPVTGDDFIRLGHKPGPNYNVVFKEIKTLWAKSFFQMSQEELINEAERIFKKCQKIGLLQLGFTPAH